LESGKHEPEVRRDMQDATALQIMGTPSFFVGKTKGDELDGDILVGVQPLSVFETRLREAEGR
jgi:predicted DsbA family dithiol-disulfide isomerase